MKTAGNCFVPLFSRQNVWEVLPSWLHWLKEERHKILSITSIIHGFFFQLRMSLNNSSERRKKIIRQFPLSRSTRSSSEITYQIKPLFYFFNWRRDCNFFRVQLQASRTDDSLELRRKTALCQKRKFFVCVLTNLSWADASVQDGQGDWCSTKKFPPSPWIFTNKAENYNKNINSCALESFRFERQKSPASFFQSTLQIIVIILI